MACVGFHHEVLMTPARVPPITMAMKDAADCRFIDADSLRYGTFRLSMPQENRQDESSTSLIRTRMRKTRRHMIAFWVSRSSRDVQHSQLR